MRAVAASVLALLVACGYDWEGAVRAPLPVEREHIGRTAMAWRADGRPWSADCAAELERLEIAPLDPEDVPDACVQANASACLREGLPALVIVGGRELAVIVDRELSPESHHAAIRHEVLHLIVTCSAADPMARADERHALPGLWESTSGQQSIEWRSRP